jgi:hypothetical protein
MAVDWPIFPQKCRAPTPKTLIIFRAAEIRVEDMRSQVVSGQRFRKKSKA